MNRLKTWRLRFGRIMAAAGFSVCFSAQAQNENTDADVPAAQEKNFRDTTGYDFPSIASVVSDMQNLTYALQLQEYCANKRISDDIVRERLARFSAMTQRTENCQTLLDYLAGPNPEDYGMKPIRPPEVAENGKKKNRR